MMMMKMMQGLKQRLKQGFTQGTNRIKKYHFSTVTTKRFNLVQTHVKAYKFLNNKPFDPNIDPLFTIHNLIGKPPMEPREIAKYQDEVMSSQLKQDVLKNWMCLDYTDPIRFVRKRYDRYAARQTIITNQVQFFEEAIRLRKLFDLDFVVPKIVEAISIKRRIIAGVVWDQVQGQDFIRELTLATDSAFQLAFRFKDSEHYLFEIEMKVDTEFNKIPPTIDNTYTKKLPQFFLV